jgi:hypothetical protein
VIAAAPEYRVRLMLISMFLHCLRLYGGATPFSVHAPHL